MKRAVVQVYRGIAEVVSGSVEVIDMDCLKEEKGCSSKKCEQILKSALEKHKNVLLVSGGCAYVKKGNIEIIGRDN